MVAKTVGLVALLVALVGVALAETPASSCGHDPEDSDDVQSLLTISRELGKPDLKGRPDLLSKKHDWLGVKAHRRGAESAPRFERCDLARSACSPAEMGGKPTLVYPGGGTACISGEEYAFAVYPGDTSRLAFYFQGGGACWVANGAFGRQVVMQCNTDMATAIEQSGQGAGILDRSDERNPFRTWTVVEPLYCSGDAFVGDAKVASESGSFQQRGYRNALAAKEWALRHFGERRLEEFVVSGFSAGALGTASWSARLLSDFSYRKASVLMDSYAALFPTGTQAATIHNWGACETPLWQAEIRSACEAGSVTIQDVLKSSMSKHPQVAFGSIQSKTDGTQMWFYRGMAQSWGMLEDMDLTGTQFFARTNDMFSAYHTSSPNFAVYYIDGSQHCFLTSANLFFTASIAGKAAAAPRRTPTLVQWVTRLVHHRLVLSQCHDVDPADDSAQRGGGDGLGPCMRGLQSAPLRIRSTSAGGGVSP